MTPRERKDQEKAALRRQILTEASRIISQKGTEGFTLRRLAQAVGYSPRTIYLYFEDKDHLLREIVEDGFRRTLEIRRENPLPPGLPPRQRMEHKLRAHISAAHSNPRFYRAVVSLLNAQPGEPGPAQQEVEKDTRQDIADLLPPQAPARPQDISLLLTAALRGVTLALLNQTGKLTEARRKNLITQFITLIDQGLSSFPEAPPVPEGPAVKDQPPKEEKP